MGGCVFKESSRTLPPKPLKNGDKKTTSKVRISDTCHHQCFKLILVGDAGVGR